ncbi:hypothetical protein CRM22_003270 [Opisthorchis felineus]|uniref:Uncharacterized protein n=1 Tax=Opisthorchis felineus TaxID=147828 RepID=A0A4S2M219_OPIFE|nr:hypothetical protein CRM22_003270 [Opisthorchis felineus]
MISNHIWVENIVFSWDWFTKVNPNILCIASVPKGYILDGGEDLDDLNWPLSGIEEDKRQTDRQNIGDELGRDDEQQPEDKDTSEKVRENESQEDSDVVDQSDAEEETEEKEYYDMTDDEYSNHSEESHVDDGWVNTVSKNDDDSDEKEPIHTDFHGLVENSESSIEQEDENRLAEKSHKDREVDESENVKDGTGVLEDARDDCNFDKGEFAAVVTHHDHIPGHEIYDDIEDANGRYDSSSNYVIYRNTVFWFG